jgi:hypothetical protein
MQQHECIIQYCTNYFKFLSPLNII